MLEINIRQARNELSHLLDRVEMGEEVILTRHGKPVARVEAITKKVKQLPNLKEFRASLSIKGDSVSETVISLRSEERY